MATNDNLTISDLCDVQDACKQSSLQIPNPVVQFSELSTDDQADLQAQIEELKFEIQRKFLKFEVELVNSLHERIATKDIVHTLTKHFTVYRTESMNNISLLQKHEQALLDAKDTKEVFIIILPFYSYYNYELLQTIVDVHGSERDKEKMQKYILEFSNYCRKVPCIEFHDHRSCQTSLKQIIIKFKRGDYDKKLLTLADIKNIQFRISDILNIRPSVLFLQSVLDGHGCIAITFIVPESCFHAVVKLLKEMTTTLQREIKMMTIECDEKPINEVLCDNKISKQSEAANIAAVQDSAYLHDTEAQPESKLGSGASSNNKPSGLMEREDDSLKQSKLGAGTPSDSKPSGSMEREDDSLKLSKLGSGTQSDSKPMEREDD